MSHNSEFIFNSNIMNPGNSLATDLPLGGRLDQAKLA